MAFTKIFGTTSGDYGTDTNWRKIAIRTADFSWTLSGSGTNEYYCRTAANANPGFAATPPTSNGVYVNGAAATKGTLGTLAAGNWGYGDNDTLGYSTVYVRLSDGTDPDTKVDGYVQFQQAPKAAENVRFAADSASINSATNIDQSGTSIASFVVEEGYSGTIGSATLGYLLLTCTSRLEFNGSGTAFINLSASAIPVQVYGTASPSSGNRGLYLKGSALTVLSIMGGSVGIATFPGDTATVTTVRVLGSSTSLWIGNGATITNLHQYNGTARVRCGVTTTILYDGTLTSEENGAWTTVTQKAGEFIYKSTGNTTTYNLYGGTLDLQKSGAARTISTLNKYAGSWTILRNKEAVTITTETPNDTYTESASV